MGPPPPRTVRQGGRSKAYRPIGRPERRAAFRAAVAAFERGDAFLAHELLEPAWMGTDDEPERDLYQGLIKLAAAEVHAVRGNARGVAKNLGGALQRLERAEAGGSRGGLDLPALCRSIRARMDALATGDGSASGPLPDATLPRPRYRRASLRAPSHGSHGPDDAA